jgi:WD40 repeat protein
MGCPGSNEGGGTIVTFRYNDGIDGGATYGWEQFGSVIEGLPTGEAAGYSISLDGAGLTMVVGFPKAANLAGSNDAGKTALYIMDAATSEWKISGEEIYGEFEGDMDGSSVAISGDGSTVVIGGRGHSVKNVTTDEVLNSAGQCHIYQFTSGIWNLQQTISGQTLDERLGTSVAVSRDGNVVTCGGVSGVTSDSVTSGVVRLWDKRSLRESTIWPRGEAGTEGMTFGESVAISEDGEYLLVGAPTWTTGGGGSAAGTIQMFQSV